MNAGRSDNQGRIFFYISKNVNKIPLLCSEITSRDDMARGKDDFAPIQASG